MAIGATAIWEVRTTGADSNGGFYTSGGTDYSQQDSAQLTVTDCVTNGTTTVTSATGGFTAAMIGNGINIAGTIRQITARTDTNTITVDATVTSATGQTAKVGGALASPAIACGNMTAGNTCYIKAGTYSISSSSANVANGRLNFTVQDSEARFIGYNTTRGDLTDGQALTRPILQTTTGMGGAYIVTLAGRSVSWISVDIDGNTQTSTSGLRLNENYVVARFSRVRRCTSRGLTISFTGLAFFCEVDGTTGSGQAVALEGSGACCFGCYAHDNTATGFYLGNSGANVIHCIAARNTVYGFWINSTGFAWNCTSHANTNHGFNLSANDVVVVGNCVSTSNSAWGYEVSSTRAKNKTLINCAHYNNTSGNVDSTDVPSQIGTIALSADPYVNASSSNFALNTTAGGGAALRAAGLPGVFPAATTTGYLDIGAVQHADPAGGAIGPLRQALIQPVLTSCLA